MSPRKRSTTGQPDLPALEPDWPALEKEELERLFYQTCRSENRPEWWSKRQRPSDVFSDVASEIFETRRGKYPDSTKRELRTLLANGCDDAKQRASIEKLTNLISGTRPATLPSWNTAWTILEHLLLGSKPSEATDGQRTIAKRIIRFFLGGKRRLGVTSKPPPFFHENHRNVAVPATVSEAVAELYHIKYARTSTKSENVSASLCLASSQGEFLPSQTDSLGPDSTRAIALDCAASGIDIFFFYPNPNLVGETPASRSVAAIEKLSVKMNLQAKVAPHLHKVPLNPGTLCPNTNRFGAEFLSYLFRYTLIRWEDRDRQYLKRTFMVSRSLGFPVGVPGTTFDYVSASTDEEAVAFDEWQLAMYEADRGDTGVPQPLLDVNESP